MLHLDTKRFLGIVEHVVKLRRKGVGECGEHVDVEQLGQGGVGDAVPTAVLGLQVAAFIVPPVGEGFVGRHNHGSCVVVQVIIHGVGIHILVPSRVEGQLCGDGFSAGIHSVGIATGRALAVIAHGIDGVLVVVKTVVLLGAGVIIIGCGETVDQR